MRLLSRSHPTRGAWIEILESKNISIEEMTSHPTRGAWIEIGPTGPWGPVPPSHPTRGAWIEIPGAPGVAAAPPRRTPHGVRGLKSRRPQSTILPRVSHPTRGAWIEIGRPGLLRGRAASHPTRGAWIEICWMTNATGRRPSHPTRGAWIEMCPPPRTPRRWCPASHPTRGAWIEIRDSYLRLATGFCRTPHGVRGLKCCGVPVSWMPSVSRTPHGVRGLKSYTMTSMSISRSSHPTRGAWIEILFSCPV